MANISRLRFPVPANIALALSAFAVLSSCEPTDVTLKFSPSNLENKGDGPYDPEPQPLEGSPGPSDLPTPRPGAFQGIPKFLDSRCIDQRNSRCFLSQPLKFVEPRNTLNPGARPLVWSSDVWGAGPDPLTGTTNGADIPAFAIPFVGDPYAPDHLRAAILHDHYTYPENRMRRFDVTQRAFYYMMRADGKPQNQAMLMYYAVVVFGEKWLIVSEDSECQPFAAPERRNNSECPEPLAAKAIEPQEASTLPVVGFPRRTDIEQMEKEFLAAVDGLESAIRSISNLPGSLGWKKDLQLVEQYIQQVHADDPIVMSALTGTISLTPELASQSLAGLSVGTIEANPERFESRSGEARKGSEDRENDRRKSGDDGSFTGIIGVPATPVKGP